MSSAKAVSSAQDNQASKGELDRHCPYFKSRDCTGAGADQRDVDLIFSRDHGANGVDAVPPRSAADVAGRSPWSLLSPPTATACLGGYDAGPL